MKVKIKSPIHIGNGDKLTKFDYLVEGKSLTVLNFDKLVSLVYKDEKSINLLLNSVEKGEGLNFFLVKKYIDKIKKYTIIADFEKFNINKEIHTFIKTSGYKPYIPGSEIKGAVRTAILYNILKDNWENFKDILWYSDNSGIVRIKNSAYKIEEATLKKENDLMKFFLVEDTSTIEPENLTVKEIKIFNSKRNFTEYAECLKEGVEIDNLNIIIKNSNHKYRDYLFNWKNCLYEYAKDLIVVEKNYWKNRNHNAYDFVYDFLKTLEENNSPQSPLLRIGRFTGKLSHTITVLLKIKELKGELRVDRSIFPKTRRLTTHGKILGWLKISD